MSQTLKTQVKEQGQAEADRLGRQTLHSYRERNIAIGVKLALGAAFVALFALRAGIVRNQEIGTVATLGLIAAMILSLALRKKSPWASTRLLPFLSINWIIVCLLLAVHANIVEHAELRHLIASLVAFSFVSSFAAQLSTIRGRYILVMPLIYVGLSCLACWGESWFPQFAFFCLIAGILNSVSCYINDRNIIRSASYEHEAREMLNAAREMERQTDLQLARAIQEEPVRADERPGDRVAISVFQTKFHGVGGDWVGWRSFGDGGTAAVVADACGKGMHAALVVRTVQTLWASWLKHKDFHAEAAFADLNSVLLNLGGSGNQVATMGLLMIEQGTLTYWSAGHVPAFARLVHPDGRDETHHLVARGPMLGFAADLSLKPAILVVPAGCRAHLLLGSDGAFPEGTRYSKAQIAAMFREVEAKGETYLKELQTDDDRSLMCLDLVA